MNVLEAAERIEKSDRLLKLTVKAPEERTIVAGIAEFYSPAELEGKQVIIAANLKPGQVGCGPSAHAPRADHNHLQSVQDRIRVVAASHELREPVSQRGQVTCYGR